MAVSKRLRYEILRRDGNRCWYCKATEGPLTIDHVTPVALGGSDDPTNLVAACKDCNAGKSASNPDAPLVAEVDERAAQFALALNRVIEERAAKYAGEAKLLRWFSKIWCSWTSTPEDRDADWETSILRFRAAGVSPDFMERAVGSAMGNQKVRSGKVWRYFCGICWNEVKAIQKQATLIVQPDTALERQPEFPYMEMFDEFLDNLVQALGGDESDRKIADFALWMAMPEAHAEWLKHPATEDEDGTYYARDTLRGSVAHDMWQIQQRRTQGGS